ncbi:hypothetical protein PHYSODRAFT_255519 [Phytophthora sojae]|uniref:feruloyl esterase n=1 Tax=Phytophthora sojae (strain P6497) TaxID=1094619 RepID=G4ZHQ2_PHYSP|nr:hypothetical protein PHYSODRAFT_255519 [Phytophthora sojae]EGZ18707.1 hypothetical protein PHYSODRAFT_255519 [Phytophthora sojae]|eukprot:XP_009527765.1 hypothetical protein PHYSODRAFT_255519 [Phytophthora sojae]
MKLLPILLEPAVNCESLLGVDLSHIAEDGSVTITSAAETTHEGILYCLVEGALPSSTNWQVMLPVRTWTQRYMQIGCGGLCAMIRMQVNAASGSQQVKGGEFVLAATDMSGSMDGKAFANNPGRRKSFAHSAQHLTALVSKTLIQAYYAQKARYSYFNGCSDGGHEGVMEAIRYPDDFDGILAGAPAMLFQFQNSLHHGWLAMSNIDGPMPELLPMMRGPPPGPEGRGPPGRAIVTASKLPLLHAAVLRACDAQDGLVDGLLSEPRLCHFDPHELLCPAEIAASDEDRQCLTEAEVNTILKFYHGPIDPVTGRHLTVGQSQYGSELAWAGVFVPRGQNEPVMSAHIALAALRYLIFEPNPPETYSLNDLQFTEATVEKLRPRHPLLDATNPDLAAFKSAGGKLILWHGWSDEHISPRTTIAYHEALEKQMGGAENVAEFERLYLFPGVQHCGRGEGMAAFDLVTPLLEWVERGSAPHAILTSTERDLPPWMPAALVVTRSRPVFPYPSLAKYTGRGDANDAANFVEGAPLFTDKTAEWAGQSFFEPYAPRTE